MEQLTLEIEKPEKFKPSDGFGQVVQFLDGHAYGIDSELRTIYLGSEVMVRAAIDGQIKLDIPARQAIIDLERKLLAEEKANAGNTDTVQAKSSRSQRIIRASNLRARPFTHSKHKPVNTRHVKTRQKLSNNKA